MANAFESNTYRHLINTTERDKRIAEAVKSQRPAPITEFAKGNKSPAIAKPV